MFAVVPRPNSYVWVTAPLVYNSVIYYQLVLIKAENIYYCENKKEWVVRCGELEYYLEDCIVPDHEDQIDVKEVLDVEQKS